MKLFLPLLPAIGLLFVAVGCRAVGPNTQVGGTIGGLSGAAIGALAGAERGKSLEGAAIGAAAGTLLGGTLGGQIDRDIATDESIRQANFEEAASHAVTLNSVSEMVASGLSDDVIAEQIRANGVLQRMTAQDLILLKQRGVSDRVINAMQQAPLVSARQTNAVIAPYPVLVREPICPPPPPIFFVGPRRHLHCPPSAYWHIDF